MLIFLDSHNVCLLHQWAETRQHICRAASQSTTYEEITGSLGFQCLIYHLKDKLRVIRPRDHIKHLHIFKAPLK